MVINIKVISAILVSFFYLSSTTPLLAEEKFSDGHMDEHEHHHGKDGHADEHEHHHKKGGKKSKHEHHHTN